MKILFLVLALGLVACSSRNYKKDVIHEAQKSEVKTPQALSLNIQEQIEKSSHLNDEQKKELEKIIQHNKSRADELLAESLKFRSVLVNELFNENSDSKKVRILRKAITEIEKKRLENTLQTIEEIRKVVNDAPEVQRLSEVLINIDRPVR